jgi:hypothetical protein
MLKRKPEEVEAWEAGESAPTYPQLEKLAYQIYKRPLAVFFLPTPLDETPRNGSSAPCQMQTWQRFLVIQMRFTGFQRFEVTSD